MGASKTTRPTKVHSSEVLGAIWYIVSIQIKLHMRFIHVDVHSYRMFSLQFLITMPQLLKEKLLLSTPSYVLDWALLLAVCNMIRQPYK